VRYRLVERRFREAADLARGRLSTSQGQWEMSRTRLKRAAMLVGLMVINYHVGAWAALVTFVVAPDVFQRIGGVGRDMKPVVNSLPQFIELLLFPTAHPIMSVGRGDYLVLLPASIGVVLALATAFLAAPAILGPAPLGVKPRSLRLSLAGAAVVGGLLMVGVIGLMLDLLCVFSQSSSGSALSESTLVFVAFAWALSGLLIAWLLARAGAARNPTGIDRWVRWLFAGTLIEATIAAPTFAVVVRRDYCFCSWSSFWILGIGAGLLAMLCGPAIILLRSRASRREWMRAACMKCGYPRRGTGPMCPECGRPYVAERQQRP
jgi:hypothetical protein